MLAKWWHNLSYLGIKSDTPEYLRDKIVLTNRLVTSLYVFIFLNFTRIAIQAPWIWWIIAIQLTVYSLVLTLNKYGYYFLSRFLPTFILPVVVTIIGSLLSHGPNYTIRMPLLAALFAPVLLFDLYKERKWVIFGILWNFLAQFAFEYVNENIIPDIPDLPGDINGLPNQLAFGMMCSLVIIFGVIYFIRLNHEARERIRALANDLQQSNEILISQAQTIAEANEELKATLQQVNDQNIIIAEANEELKASLQQISEQNAIIARKNQDIIESIEYAKRIQTTILPAEEIIRPHLPKSFFYYQPKDIVSGDFYWFVHIAPYSFLAAIDCTGHGVPGAFMSVMAYNQLNQIVIEREIHQPASILNTLDQSVRTALKQDEIGSTSRDGMDLTLARFDHQNNQVVIASAQRPFYLFQRGQLQVLKGDRFPIGFSIHDDKVFTEYQISLTQGDRLYLFSDGITDQFGGDKGRKLTAKKFEQLINESQHLPMPEQKVRLQSFMKEWMNYQEQLDDMMVIGVEW
jgi:serine phosphatase RsbU (regulator of sigma subunit)